MTNEPSVFDGISKQDLKSNYFTFIHTADSHNGHSGNASRYNEYEALKVEKVTEKGINVRQDDIDKAFAQVMDIALEHEVDAVIHAGDGTDSWGYKKPYVYNTYLRQISRIRKKNIPYIEIVGNHNLPKQAGVGCYLESLGAYPGILTSYKGFYETIEIPEHNVVLHCVPSTFTQEILDESLAAVEPVSGKINIGVGHFGVTSIKHYAENADSSLVVSLDALIQSKMDYFALGDYHKAMDFGYNIRYCGSPERMGFGEIDNKPQVLVVAIHKQTKEVLVQPIFLDVRPMIDLKLIDATDKSLDRINELILERLGSTNLDGAIVRLRVTNLPKEFKQGIDIDKVNELTANCLYFKFDLKNKVDKSSNIRTSSEVKMEGILDGWKSFMDKAESDETFDLQELFNMGHELLSDALEEQN